MTQPKTFYLAAPSSDIPRAQALARRVQGATGCTLTHDWMRHILDGNPPSAKAALDDLKAIYDSDFVVLIDGPSRGASVELGFAIGTGTPVFALSENPDMWLEASCENSKPADWGVRAICATEDELLEQLRLWVSLRS